MGAHPTPSKKVKAVLVSIRLCTEKRGGGRKPVPEGTGRSLDRGAVSRKIQSEGKKNKKNSGGQLAPGEEGKKPGAVEGEHKSGGPKSGSLGGKGSWRLSVLGLKKGTSNLKTLPEQETGHQTKRRRPDNSKTKKRKRGKKMNSPKKGFKKRNP